MIPEILTGIVETIVSEKWSTAVPIGVSVFSEAIQKYLFKRYKVGRDAIYLEFSRSGEPSYLFKHPEEIAAAAIRFERAIRDQAGDANLKLLAQAMMGLARRHELWADTFIKYAEILAPLTRDEIIFLGSLSAAYDEICGLPDDHRNPPDPWKIARSNLQKIFPEFQHIMAVGAQIQRSALVLSIDTTNIGAFRLSPLGVELRSYVNIERALGNIDE